MSVRPSVCPLTAVQVDTFAQSGSTAFTLYVCPSVGLSTHHCPDCHIRSVRVHCFHSVCLSVRRFVHSPLSRLSHSVSPGPLLSLCMSVRPSVCPLTAVQVDTFGQSWSTASSLSVCLSVHRSVHSPLSRLTHSVSPGPLLSVCLYVCLSVGLSTHRCPG